MEIFSSWVLRTHILLPRLQKHENITVVIGLLIIECAILLFFFDFPDEVSTEPLSPFFDNFPSFGPTKYSSRDTWSSICAAESPLGDLGS